MLRDTTCVFEQDGHQGVRRLFEASNLEISPLFNLLTRMNDRDRVSPYNTIQYSADKL